MARLGWDDVFAGLRLLIASFIVLPLLPNRTVDPWGALNPYSMWLQVLLISGLSLVGYAATRWLGSDKGIALTSITGGLVSSTAITLSFVQQSRERAGASVEYALAGGIILAWCIMFARVVTEVLVVNRALVTSLLAPFGAMGIVACLFAWVYFRRHATVRSDRAIVGRDVAVKNPFSLTAAVKFAAFFAAVLLVMKIVQQNLPAESIYVVATRGRGGNSGHWPRRHRSAVKVPSPCQNLARLIEPQRDHGIDAAARVTVVVTNASAPPRRPPLEIAAAQSYRSRHATLGDVGLRRHGSRLLRK